MFLSSKEDVTFKEYFFLLATQWNNLDLNIRKSYILNIFRNSILKFITLSADSVFNNSHNQPWIYHKTKARSDSLAEAQLYIVLKIY